jgi:hypothetical protein
MEVMPKSGAWPFGIRRVIILANDFAARSVVKLPVLKMPVLMIFLYLRV